MDVAHSASLFLCLVYMKYADITSMAGVTMATTVIPITTPAMSPDLSSLPS